MSLRLVSAIAAGALIGLERSYRGRPAGFRTHALVCTASTLLMLITAYESLWLINGTSRTVLDPTRMAQGIMTGIGFLGAGVIVKDGVSVRGLTTAGSIWITAAIGILIGIGFYFPACMATMLTLGILSVFRLAERKMPSEFYANFVVRFPREDIMDEAQLRAVISEHHIDISNLNYSLVESGRQFEYHMTLRTMDASNTRHLSARLTAEPSVVEFKIAGIGS